MAKVENGLAKQRDRLRTIRVKVWRGMRILRKFTVLTLLSTTGEVVEKEDIGLISNWLSQLTYHGYVRRFGGRPRGGHQMYILVKSPASMPIVCDECGSNIFKKGCSPFFFKKEKQRETKRKKQEEKKAGSMADRITDTQWATLKHFIKQKKEDHA